ncbi:MAG: type IV pilus assembly protein PilM [Acidobacteriota bacterium]|nr:pilus assembly protein PilM [Blastocatellia bacterium]MDW8413347.1 type IV pilus assembly protein PilM [Acidobacteriota bacterium]
MGLFDFITGGKKSVVGLDIGSSAVKAVELKGSRGNYELVSIGHVTLLSDTIVDGHIIDLNHVSDAINRIFQEQGIKTNLVGTSVSGHSVIVKKINMPVMSQEELAEKITWEAEEYIPFSLEEVNLSYEIAGIDASGTGMDVLLVACKKEKIAQYTQVINQAGKQLHFVDVDSFAVQAAYELNYDPMPTTTVALLNIGASVMNINVVRGTTSVFTRDISVGGNQYTDLLQKELNLTFEEAESLKRGLPTESGVRPEDVQQLIKSVSEILALEVQKTLDFFRGASSSMADVSKVDRMLISGGSSKVPGLTGYMAERFGVPVDRFDSFRKIKYNTKKFDEDYIRELSPNMAVAVGLALRSGG